MCFDNKMIIMFWKRAFYSYGSGREFADHTLLANEVFQVYTGRVLRRFTDLSGDLTGVTYQGGLHTLIATYRCSLPVLFRQPHACGGSHLFDRVENSGSCRTRVGTSRGHTSAGGRGNYEGTRRGGHQTKSGDSSSKLHGDLVERARRKGE